MLKTNMNAPAFRKNSVFNWAALIAVFLLTITNAMAQVGISNVSITPHASSVLELRSTTLGFLPPRMTTAERDAIVSPSTGLVVYNTTTSQLNYHNGSSWQLIGIADMITKTYKGRTSAGTGQPEDVPVATLKTDLVLVKADVGLANVDNTSDANKPVSTAEQTALNLKANIASPTFTGVPAGPTAAATTNTTQLATTAFVTTADNLKANIASPTFTGIPAGPTASVGTNTTQLASTAFVLANTAAGIQPYAAFSSSTTQLVTSVTIAKLITFETNEALNLITHSTTVNPSQIIIQVAGTYIITTSISLAGGVADADIWLRLNGTDVPRSNTRMHYLSTDNRVMTITFIMSAVANDYFELVQSSTTTSGGPTAIAAGTNPTRPSIPSVILTINKISN